ncbi:MAG: tandem-95 repeat protein [Rhodopirellula sp.]|nr:tandem-95 repeat protein [Rhodopirellula sp.]
MSEFAANGDSVGTATATDQDAVGTISNWMIVSGNNDGVFELDPSSGKLRVADNARLNFEMTATYVLGLSVQDGANTSSTETVTIHVIDENDNPVLLANAGISVVEGGSIVISSTELSVSDEDELPDEIQYSVIDAPMAGRLELIGVPGNSISTFTQADIDSNRVQFVHDGSEADDSFTFVVSDGSGGTIGPTLFSITNLRVNDAPINLVPGSQLTSEDSPLTFSFAMGNEITVTDVDLNGAMIGVRLVATHGTVTLGSTAGLVFASGTGIADSDVVFAGLIADVNAALDGLRFDPTPDYNGPASIRIISRDMGNSGSGGEQIDDDTIDIFVTAVNDNPVATGDEFSTTEDNILTVTAGSGLLSNDADIDGDTLSVVAVTGTANGSLSLNADGSFVYTPNLDFNGTDSFTYRATDGSLQSETRTVTLNVAAVNDAPVSSDDSYTMDQLTVLKVEAADGVLINDIDIEADKLQAVLINGPQNGHLILNADGSLTYTPDASFASEVTFTYRAFDGTAAGSIATVRIIVRQTVTSGMPGSNGDAVTVEADTSDGEGMTDGNDKTRIVAAGAVNPAGNTSSNLSANMPTNMSMTDSDSTTTAADDGSTDSDAGLNGNLHNELHAFATTFRIDERGELRDRMTDRSFEDAGVVFSSTDVGSMVYVLEQTGFWTELDTFQQDVKDSVLQEGQWEELVVETTTVAGTTLTVGYIVWLLRSGSFVFGLISSLPAWTMMDPLPVLQSGLERCGDGDNSDDDSLLGILQAHQHGMEPSAESFEI